MLDFISSPLFVVPALVVIFFASILWATAGQTGSEGTASPDEAVGKTS